MNLIVLAFLGLLLGVSLAGPPGPVTAILVNRSMQSIAKGISVGLGAMTADFILMILILFFGIATQISRFDPYIYALGAVFFIYLAFLIARSKEGGSEMIKGKSGFLAGFTIGIVNPMQIGWWFTAGLSVFQRFGILALIFLFVGIIIWVVFLATLVYRSTARYGNLVKTVVKIFSVVSLSFFGILFLYLSLTSFLPAL